MNVRKVPNKIERFDLVQDMLYLHRAGYSGQEIAEMLTNSDKVPESVSISRDEVNKYLKKAKETKREIAVKNKKIFLDVIHTELDIMSEMQSNYMKTKTLLEALEKRALDDDRLINPYQYKALISEMREGLSQLKEIQKELNDANNIKRFMEIVLQTLKEECPDKIPIIAEKLKIAKETLWFSQIFKR